MKKCKCLCTSIVVYFIITVMSGVALYYISKGSGVLSESNKIIDKTENSQTIIEYSTNTHIGYISLSLIGSWTLTTLGFIVLVIYILRYNQKLTVKQIDNIHELNLIERRFSQEKYWRDEEKKKKDSELKTKIEEFEKLTSQSKILDKVLEKDLKEKCDKLEDSFNALRKEFEENVKNIHRVILDVNKDNKENKDNTNE